MRSILSVHFILGFVPIIIVSPCFSAEPNAPSKDSKYIEAVREFGDNVLKYGRDTYGPKHTPLFVDGVNVNTHEPVKWISPVGGDPLTATETEEWILSNFASQQTLLRTLDGLSTLTDDPKYRDAAMQATKYVFENLRAPNGLFYWGEVTAYDALTEEIKTYKHAHAFKVHYPYYELMWRVNPEETKRFIEAYWSGHIIDWSNLDFNRSVEYINTLNLLKTSWDYEYKGGPTFFLSKVGWASGFIVTGTSLAHAATTLCQLSDQEQPLIWSKRLIQRFVDTRHPNTGISLELYNQPQRSFVGGGMEAHFNDPRVGVFPIKTFAHPVTRVRNLYQYEEILPLEWLSVLLMGEELGEQGREFTQWAREELTAWGRVSYRAKDNVLMPILTDGTSIEGVVLEETFAAGASKGCIATPLPVDVGFLRAYATAYKTTGDAFMWQMTRDIARGNGFGDIGEVPGQTPALNGDTTSSDAYSLLAFLELYSRTTQKEFLAMARRIADNIVATKFRNGFFVPSHTHIYTRFDCFEPLALLHLTAVLESHQELMPRVWPNSPHFVAPYRYKEQGIDWQTIYALTEAPVLSLSLQEVAAIGDVNAVRTLIDEGADVDGVEDAFQKTALHRAGISGHKDVVELLLAENARIDAKDGVSGKTALHYAAERGHKGIVELLINKGADANIKISRHPKGDTPLHVAVKAGHKDIVALLISKGADVNAKNDQGKAPIEIAMGQGRMDIASVLIDNGAEASFVAKMRVNMARMAEERQAKEKEAGISIHTAAQNGDQEVIKSLLAQGIDINVKDDKGNTPLLNAVMKGHGQLVRFLVDQGADINAQDSEGNTALYYAIQGRNGELARLLIEKGADISMVLKSSPPVLMYAVMSNDIDIVKLLLEKGARPDSEITEGMTVFQYAVSTRKRAIVELCISQGIDSSDLYMAACAGDLAGVKNLVEQGADINAQDTLGMTPLYYAASMAREDVAEFLLDKGAQVGIEAQDGTISLHQAAYSGTLRLVELLIVKGANVNAKSRNNITPLHRAVTGGHKDIVAMLIARGADINAENRIGETPLALARQAGSTEIVALLTKAAEEQKAGEKETQDKKADEDQQGDEKENPSEESLAKESQEVEILNRYEIGKVGLGPPLIISNVI